jgi:hypothetical protein
MKLLCLTALLLVIPIAAQGKGEPVPLQPSKLTLSIDSQGKPSDVACAEDVAEPICSVLVRAVSQWEFSPGRISGANAAMDAWLTLTMEALPRDDGFGLRAVDAKLGHKTAAGFAPYIDFESRRLNPPQYPAEELKQGLAGTAVLELWHQPGTDLPRIGKVWFDGRPANNRDRLAQAAVRAAKAWRLMRGNPNQLSLCLPVAFYSSSPSAVSMDTAPCQPTFVEGYALPVLLTDVTTALF